MILSAAEQQLIETLRHVSNLTLIVHADRGQCHVRIARNGGEFAAGSGEAGGPPTGFRPRIDKGELHFVHTMASLIARGPTPAG